MPLIHMYVYSGKDDEFKKKAAEALMKAACESMGVEKTSFTLIYEDVEKEAWVKQINEPILETNRDKLVIEWGEPRL